ncbi:unnamed protein product, partial [Meganyctiphanes norvegica]
EEVALLKAQCAAIKSRLNPKKKENEYDIVQKDREKNETCREENSSIGFVAFSKESIKEQAEEFELDVLPPTCPMGQDSDEDLFGSLPNLTNSTVQPSDTQEEEGNICKGEQKSLYRNISETGQDGDQITKDDPNIKKDSENSFNNMNSSFKNQNCVEDSKILNNDSLNSNLNENKLTDINIKFISGSTKHIENNEADNVSTSAECQSAASSNIRPSQSLVDGYGPAVFICTGLTSAELTVVNKFIVSLAPPGTSVKKVWSSEVTHVIVKPDEDGQAQRTLKYLYGVAASRWIVSFKWIQDCLSRNNILNEDDYEVVDTTGQEGPSSSRKSIKPLFNKAEFYLVPPFNDISIQQLTELLELCGAHVVPSVKHFSINPNGGIMQLVLFQSDGDDEPQDFDGNGYSRLCVAHDWVVECIGTFSHLAIRPYLMCDASIEQINNSGVSPLLVDETQDIQ